MDRNKDRESRKRRLRAGVIDSGTAVPFPDEEEQARRRIF